MDKEMNGQIDKQINRLIDEFDGYIDDKQRDKHIGRKIIYLYIQTDRSE